MMTWLLLTLKCLMVSVLSKILRSYSEVLGNTRPELWSILPKKKWNRSEFEPSAFSDIRVEDGTMYE